jgi:RHS repeat-associated protein
MSLWSERWTPQSLNAIWHCLWQESLSCRMKRSDIKKLHFISPIENLASILEYGILCHNRAKELPHQSVAMNEIEETRRDKRIPGAGVLHDYENLYFDAHNPMLSRLRSLNDRLGTPEILTDASGTVAWEAWHEPFGEAHMHPSSSVVNNIRLPGQYYDAETGLHYNYHRYYDPRTGRYITPDPIGLLGGINLFPYAQNNPINTIDPFGLRWSLGSSVGLLILDYGWDSSNPSRGILSVVLGQLGGAGWHFTWTTDDNACDTVSGEVIPEPFTWNFGLGKYLGISFAEDLSSFSINLGLGLGFPVSVSRELEGDFSFGAQLYDMMHPSSKTEKEVVKKPIIKEPQFPRPISGSL